MVTCDGIEVSLVRQADGQRYTEYIAPPGPEAHTGFPNEVYAEVQDSKRFLVKQTIQPEFRLHRAADVKTTDQVGNHRGTCCSHSK